jgi:hypothetical protein
MGSEVACNLNHVFSTLCIHFHCTRLWRLGSFASVGTRANQVCDTGTTRVRNQAGQPHAALVWGFCGNHQDGQFQAALLEAQQPIGNDLV